MLRPHLEKCRLAGAPRGIDRQNAWSVDAADELREYLGRFLSVQ
jgi:hypothetical protein